MTSKIRLPRHHRLRFQRLPLPTWLRLSVLTVGWVLILLGILGLWKRLEKLRRKIHLRLHKASGGAKPAAGKDGPPPPGAP